MRVKRGLSPIVSTLILLIAAVVGGIIVYNYFMKAMSTMTGKPTIIVNSAEIASVDYTTNTTVLMLSLTNMGPSQVTLKHINFLCGSSIIGTAPEKTVVKVPPGGTWSGLLFLPVAIPQSCNKAVLVVATADGKTFTTSVFSVTFAS